MTSDNGSGYSNQNVRKILENYGIQHQRTVRHNPEQNGSADRDMRTIVETARTMLHAKGLHLELWAVAVNTAVYILDRTDIAYAVGKVSQFLENPQRIHWYMVKTIMKYLKGSMNLGTQFKANGEMILKGFSDADYAADITKGRSISGYIFHLENSPI
ncbi:hypothetical protein JTB14_026057 [Gonioctena quinquepunctata]|nr:hypothetical protein JTB14_026057 [Gonioctena quinquepunctata]